MEKNKVVKEENKRTESKENQEKEKTPSNSDQGLDNETIQILLDDRISTGG